MKKFLSLFIALAMALSVFSGVVAPKASAATGLKTADSVTGVPTYTMGDIISGTTEYANTTAVYLVDTGKTTIYASFQTASTGAGQSFVLTTANTALKDGQYLIVENSVWYNTDTNYAGLAATETGAVKIIYIKYNSVLSVPSSLAIDTVNAVFAGHLYLGNGAPASGVYVGLVNGAGTTFVQSATTDGTGYFIFVVPSLSAYGTYYLKVGTTATTTTATSAAYASWSVAAGALKVAPAFEPTLLYSGITGQNLYIYVSNDDGPVTSGLTFTYVSPSTVGTAVPVGDGVYAIPVTTAVAGMLQVTASDSVSSGSATFNVVAPSNGWNPSINGLAITDATGDGVLDISDKVSFTVVFNATYLHDQMITLSGPVSDSAKSYGAPILSAYSKTFTNEVISCGGQIDINVQANLWSSSDEYAATSTAVAQDFKMNPTIVGDVVNISTDTVNVGDTKDVTVQVSQPSGVERNNGVVVLTGTPNDSTVTNMFTIPSGSAYTTENSAMPAPYKYSGNVITLDAKGANVNIVGGKYVFSGITFNHSGTVTVATYGKDGVTLTGLYTEYITVSPRIHTLTADVDKFVAGATYPVVNVTSGIKSLAFSSALNDTVFSYVDNGNGSYVFNFASPVEYRYNYYDYSYTMALYAQDPNSADDIYLVEIPIVKPAITIAVENADDTTSADGLVTKGFAETFAITVTNPVTGAAMTPKSSDLGVQYTYWGVTGYKNLPVSSMGGQTANYGSHYVYNVAGDPLTIGVTADYGNENLDITVDKPYLSLGIEFGNYYISYSNQLLVTAPTFTFSVKGMDTLQMYVNQSNTITISAVDAHSKPLVDAYAAIVGSTSGSWAENTVSSSDWTAGGITGADGSTTFTAIPTYTGNYKALLAANDGDTAIAKKIVPSVNAPADTTAPTIKITDGIDGSTVTSDTLTLTGTVTDNVKVAAVYVGNNKVELLPDGSFQTAVKLAAGDNTINVTAYDAAGNKATVSVKVTYTAPKTGTVIVLTIGTDIVTVNGKATSVAAAPEIVNGRTFVPLRFIAETFGADVEWLAETQGITITLGDDTIGLQIGNATAVINGNITSLDAAPYIKNSSTMVPLRVISESFGGNVAWDPALRTITITYVQP